MQDEKNPKPPPTPPIDKGTINLMQQSGIGMEMVLTIVFVGAVGYGFDYLVGTWPVGFLVGVVVGVAAGFYVMIRSALKVGNR